MYLSKKDQLFNIVTGEKKKDKNSKMDEFFMFLTRMG